ncbi:MAG: hypothetical protein IPK13_07405 [Deltaproteobacteria bacterium]|nr:hypothetical protein [Deltaproteobacteria bacterium]
MSILSDFLNENTISPADVHQRSCALEAQNIDDRALQVGRQAARRAKKPYAELSLGKPKGLGRGVGVATVQRAIAGAPLPRVARKKIVRAVNSLLASRKMEPTDARKLFSDAPARKGKSGKKK